MTTLVTGGRGFVGRHLVDQLLADGGKVVSYNRDFSVDARDGLTAVQGELFDIPRLTDTLRTLRRRPHHPHRRPESPRGVDRTAVDHVHGQCRGHPRGLRGARVTGVRRIVNFSSECAVGTVPIDAAVREDVKTQPDNALRRDEGGR